jgi:hypothetical protein
MRLRRLDFVVMLALGVMTTFVAHEAIGARARASRHATSFGATRLSDDSTNGTPTMREAAIPAAAAHDGLTPADRAEARHLLAAASAGTYMGEILAERDSAITRWPERLTNPLRVWVQPVARLKAFNPDFVPIVRDAFTAWTDAGVPLSFTFVLDSASADVRVTWIDHFGEPISGKTLWAHDDKWWIVEANIVLALHHQSGQALDQSAIRAIALHEVGHLIGLDHTTDSTAIMSPRVRVKELAAADRATAQLLYELPPGPIK